ncbi:MAG: hypothetical protein IK015_06540 [Treponema sp.]|nr:hypothetical protein [Treponema sp.]
MDELKAEHLKGLCVIEATKHLMQKYDYSHEEAYKKFLDTDIYNVLMNSDSDMFLEDDSYIKKALDLELSENKAAMYNFIQNN